MSGRERILWRQGRRAGIVVRKRVCLLRIWVLAVCARTVGSHRLVAPWRVSAVFREVAELARGAVRATATSDVVCPQAMIHRTRLSGGALVVRRTRHAAAVDTRERSIARVDSVTPKRIGRLDTSSLPLVRGTREVLGRRWRRHPHRVHRTVGAIMRTWRSMARGSSRHARLLRRSVLRHHVDLPAHRDAEDDARRQPTQRDGDLCAAK